MNDTAKKVIEKLEKQYSDDTDAVDEIKRAKTTIKYHEKNGDINKAISTAYQLEAFLHDWY